MAEEIDETCPDASIDVENEVFLFLEGHLLHAQSEIESGGDWEVGLYSAGGTRAVSWPV